MSRTRMYHKGKLVKENFPLADVSDYLKEPDTLVWLDVKKSQEDEVHAIHEELGLHELAVEDALQPHERPKLSRYATHQFLNCFALRLDTKSGQVTMSGIAAFVVPNAVVTVTDEDFPIDEVVSRWDTEPELSSYGVGYLLYGLIDYVVDSHLDAAEALDDQLEALEDLLFEDRPKDREMQRRTFELRKSLVRMRRVVVPMRELVNGLMRRDPLPGKADVEINPDLDPYFQDLYDHTLRASDWLDSLRELVATVFETHLNVRSNRLNVIMKQVTSWAAIIAVPTAITGFYGQNVPYPGYGHVAGFWTSSAVIVGLSGLLFLIFKRKDWL
jgi:magnesium transporter